jgi:hypothetical protein
MPSQEHKDRRIKTAEARNAARTAKRVKLAGQIEQLERETTNEDAHIAWLKQMQVDGQAAPDQGELAETDGSGDEDMENSG